MLSSAFRFDKIFHTKAGVKALYYVGIESVKSDCCPRRDFQQNAKSRVGTLRLVTRAYIKEITCS